LRGEKKIERGEKRRGNLESGNTQRREMKRIRFDYGKKTPARKKGTLQTKKVPRDAVLIAETGIFWKRVNSLN